MTKRRTLAEAFAETKAAAPARAAAAKRASRAQREAMSPVPADAAVVAYEAAAQKLAARVAKAVAKAGSDPEALMGALAGMAKPMVRHAFAAAKRINKQAKREVVRMLRVDLPAGDERERVLIQLFVDRNMAAYRKVLQDVAAAARTGESLPLWRMPLIARAESWQLQGAVLEHWAVSAGSESYVWHTRRDWRVRDGHAHLEGKTFTWASPPATGRREGNNHPGQAVACRCVPVPVEAFE